MGHSDARPGGWWALALTLGVVLLLSACGGNADAEGSGAEGREAEGAGGPVVVITHFLFEPQEIEVSPGTDVTWINKDSALHNVQDLSDLNIPISRELPEGYRYSIRYEEPGSYPYVCGLHPYMTGTVKVV